MISKHAPFHVVLGVVLGLLFIAFFAFTLGRMSVNALLFLSVVALAGMMLLGIFVSLHPDRAWVKQRRTAISIIFAGLGISGALVASIQGLRANRETFGVQDQLAEANKRIGDQNVEVERARSEMAKVREEAARTQILNSELQRKLLDQSTQMKELAVQRVAEVTGGDGFAYLDLGVLRTSEQGVALQARVNGSYDLRQVKYRLGEGTPVVLGDLAASASRVVDTVLPGGRYQITLDAANGAVKEDLELRFNAAKKLWERRLRVSRGNQIVLERAWGR